MNDFAAPSNTRLVTKIGGISVRAINVIGNMFSNTSLDLCVLETRPVMPKVVAKSYSTIEEIDTVQYLTFRKERIEECIISMNQPITRNNVNLFGRLPKIVPQDKMTILNLKT